MRRILICILCIVFAVMIFVSCSDETDSPEVEEEDVVTEEVPVEESEPETVYEHTIAFLAANTSDAKTQAVLNTVQSLCTQYNYELQVFDAQGSADIQSTQTQKAIDAGAELMILQPTDPDEGIRIMTESYSNGVPVVVDGCVYTDEELTVTVDVKTDSSEEGSDSETEDVSDSDIQGESVDDTEEEEAVGDDDSGISDDDEQSEITSEEVDSIIEEGVESAQNQEDGVTAEVTLPVIAQFEFSGYDIGFNAITAIKDEFDTDNPGKLLYIHKPMNTSFYDTIKDGFNDALEKYNSSISTVGIVEATDEESSASAVAEWLAGQYSDFNAVYADSDELMLGCLTALEAAGIDTDAVVCVSCGGSDVGYDLLDSNRILCDITTPASVEGAQLFKFCYQQLNDVAIEENVISRAPEILTPTYRTYFIAWDDVEGGVKEIGGIE